MPVGRQAVVVVLLAVVSAVSTTGCFAGDPVTEIAFDAGKSREELPEPKFASDDWPWWRGPNRNGIAAEQEIPVRWSKSENVIWKTPVAGRGHSSPTIVGDRIFLSTADERTQTQSVVCYQRADGKLLWTKELFSGGFPGKGKAHQESSHASCTVACDGERLFVAFLNHDTIWSAALDLDGNELWRRELGSFSPLFGYGPSPVIYKSLVIVAADHQAGGFLAGVHRKSGEIAWRTPRRALSSYSSPMLANIAGKDQLLISGTNLVASYDPGTGRENWSCDGTTAGTCGTMVYEGDLAFASGGYPDSETICVRADGSNEVLWRNKHEAYVPSMLVHGGSLFSVDDRDGILHCFEAATGKETWKKRVKPRFRASPVLCNGHIYLTNVLGTTYVYKANGKAYEPVAENQLGEETYATPTICGSRIYIRTAEGAGADRRETLYCIGNVAGDKAGE